MQWAFLAIGTIAVVELLCRLPVAETAHQVMVVVRRILKTLKSNLISDHWKEQVLPVYAGRLLVASLSLLVMLVLALLPLALLAVIAAWMEISLLAFLMDYRGILASLIIACGYLAIRNRLRNSLHYV